MNKYRDFIEEMQTYLGFDVWHQKNKYVIGGAEFSLGESISDVLNFDFSLLDKPFQAMDLIISRTPQSKIPNTDLIAMVQTLTNKMLDVLFAIKPFSELPIDRSEFRDRLTGINTLNRAVFDAYFMRFLMLRSDVLRTQLLFNDLLDNYFDRNFPEKASAAYEQFLDDCADTKNIKQYTDLNGRVYAASEIAAISSPIAIDFGIPPTGTSLNGVCEVIRFSSPYDFYHWELMRSLMEGSVIKRCKCCGKFFQQARGGYVYEYCAGIAPGEKTRTCRQIGSLRSHDAKIKGDPIWGAYRRAYKKFHARVLKGHMTQEEFVLWADAAFRLRDRTMLEAKDVPDYPLEGYLAMVNDPEFYRAAEEE
jgi:hypothetical protein